MQTFNKSTHNHGLTGLFSKILLLALLLTATGSLLGQSATQTATVVASNGSGNAWSPLTASNLATSDGNSISATAGTPTQFLDLTGFNFNLPSGATIDGIEVTIKRRKSAGNRNIRDNTIQLLKAGSPAGQNKAVGTDWPPSYETANYGGTTDLWMTSWTEAEIEASDFGLRIAIENFGGSGPARDGQIDQVQITVYYSSSCNLTASAGTITDVTCNGDDDGSIEMTTSMGTGVNGEYDYAWSGAESGSANGQDDSYTIPSLSGGTYDITVTNGAGCTAEVTGVVVNEPAALSATPGVTDVSTNGGSDGQIELTISGGTGDYDIAWEEDGNTSNNGSANNQSSPYDITGLTAGDYDITITDDNSCELVLQDVTVDEPEVCDITASGLSGVTNNDGGTPNDPTDDPIILSLNPTGNTAIGTTYTVTATQDGDLLNVAPAAAQNYGSPVSFTFTATGGNSGPAGFGNIVVTITDGDTPGCTLVIDPVTDPGTGSTCPGDPYSGAIQTPVINN